MVVLCLIGLEKGLQLIDQNIYKSKTLKVQV